MDRLRQLLEQLRVALIRLPPSRRWGLLALSSGTLAAVMLLWGMLFRDPMVPLFDRPIDEKTAREVMEILNKQNVQYSVDRATAAILVPASKKQTLRIETTSETGLSTEGTGFELFDETGFGSTQFVERIRYTRALQGEIERQINGFAKVRGSKVLLSLPEQSLFTEDREDPSASVYLELATSAVLSAEEGERIASMVSHAVPRLRPDKVEILDGDMRVIHAASTGDGQNSATDRLAESRRQYERYYQRKIESLLERVVGPGKVVARVSVELDHTAKNSVERRLDGDRAVAVSQRTRESSTTGSASSPQGVPGTTTNLPELAGLAGAPGGGAGSSPSRSTESDEIGNFDVPETRVQTTSAPGGILGVTAAVLIDGRWVDAQGLTATATTPADQRTFQAATAAELAGYTAMVAKAIGTEVENVTVSSQQFADVELTAATATSTFLASPESNQWLRYGLGIAAFSAILFVVVRPVVKSLTTYQPALQGLSSGMPGGMPLGPSAEALAGLPKADQQEALHAWLSSISGGGQTVTRDEVNRLVVSDVPHSVSVIQSWIAKGR